MRKIEKNERLERAGKPAGLGHLMLISEHLEKPMCKIKTANIEYCRRDV